MRYLLILIRLRIGLLLRNHTSGELRIATNGHVTAGIVD